MKVFVGNCLCEHISKLVFWSNKRKANHPFFKILFNEMSVYLDMFCPVMLNWILRNCNCSFIMQYRFIPELGVKPILESNLLIQRSSQKPLGIPLNLASALDKATTFYFLLLHVTKLPPTKVK
jgi:hypothetical protein